MPLPANLSADDREWVVRGFHFSRDQLFAELSSVGLPSLGMDFQVPVFYFEGAEDQQTPIELAEENFSRIMATAKAFVRLKGCHHFVVMNRPNDFLTELVRRVLPVVSAI